MSILIAVVSGFASGIFIRSLFVFGWEPIVFVFILAGIFVGARFLTEPRRAYSLGALFCIFIALGMARAMVADSPLPSVFAHDLKHRVSYDGVVVADPDVRDASQRIEIRVSSGDSSTVLLAVAPRSPSVMVGDRVHVSGTLAVPEPFAGDNGRVFRYDKYLQRDAVRFMLNFAYLRVTKPAPWYSIPSALARVKHAFLGGLAATLPEPYSSLAGGVVIGGKTGLGTELQDAFVKSGLVQIIVLSGYNVMIVAEWVMAALAYLKLSRRWSSLAGALAILIFVGIAGASATAVRAALMAFIALYARATGKSYSAGRALLAVVFLMLVWNPLYLAFDPGFGLSVVATAGLIWFAPIIESLLSFIKNPFWKNAVATTLAAQIAVLPLLLYDTGNLSLVAIPANIITMPIVPLTMALSALAGFAGIVFGALSPIVGIALAFPAYLANAFLIFVAETSASLPFAAFTLPAFPFVLVLTAYAALIYIVASKRFSTTLQLRLAKNAST
ncbi:MAG: ComEC/Rec2 family competence protein [Minisyncoccota bacterium]